MEKLMLIGIVGAPGSGKSTLAARLYADLMELGINSSRLVTEFAVEWLGQGNEINTRTQRIISITQEDREQYSIDSKFDPIICDSVIWLGAVYAELGWGEAPKDLDREMVNGLYHRTLNRYDITIYVPLFDAVDKTNTFRIHNAEQSKRVDDLIREKLKLVKNGNWVQSPKKIEERSAWIKNAASFIMHRMEDNVALHR